MSDAPSNPLITKLRAMADAIDPQTDGIAILIVGDVRRIVVITSTGNDQYDAKRLADGLVKDIAWAISDGSLE